MTQPGQSDIAPGRVWISPAGNEWVVRAPRGTRVQLARVGEPGLDARMTVPIAELRRSSWRLSREKFVVEQ